MENGYCRLIDSVLGRVFLDDLSDQPFPLRRVRSDQKHPETRGRVQIQIVVEPGERLDVAKIIKSFPGPAQNDLVGAALSQDLGRRRSDVRPRPGINNPPHRVSQG